MSTEMDALLERRYAPDHPQLGSGPVSIEPYVSADYFDLERRKIFRDAWLLACHESDIPNPGDYLIKDAALFKASILIVRASDGKVRAFHNVCQHRGNKVICENGYGNVPALFCKFHGWTYALDGKLRGVPESDRFHNLNKQERGLKPFSLQIWKGLVFVNASANPAKSLREYLGTLGDALEEYPFESMRPLAHHSGTVRANWKVGINAFQEAYHVPTVHAVSAPTLFVNRLVHFRFHGPHRAMTLPISAGFRPRPLEILSSRLTSGMSRRRRSVEGGTVSRHQSIQHSELLV